jgi:hypothetical protein
LIKDLFFDSISVMNINSVPRLKDTKLKIKKTFAITESAADTYVKAREHGIDTTKMCSDALEKTLAGIRELITKKST